MFKVGQRVKVTDQRPPAEGVIEDVSTWQERGQVDTSGGRCYYIRCAEWQNSTRWISEYFVKPI